VLKILELVQTQTKSLKRLSLVQEPLSADKRWDRNKLRGRQLEINQFTALEYLDIIPPVLVKTKQPIFESSLEWLGLPTSLQTLSIYAIDYDEIPYVEIFLEYLLDAVKTGSLPNLKDVRCGFLRMQDGMKMLENMPGKFLCYGVGLTGCHYSDEKEEGKRK
jgi:hypothetical protein